MQLSLVLLNTIWNETSEYDEILEKIAERGRLKEQEDEMKRLETIALQEQNIEDRAKLLHQANKSFRLFHGRTFFSRKDTTLNTKRHHTGYEYIVAC
jgi:hypothetical protein